MVIVMKPSAVEEDILHVTSLIEKRSCAWVRTDGSESAVIVATGDTSRLEPREFRLIEGVHEVARMSPRFKLAARNGRTENTVIDLGGGVVVGGPAVVLMAGPCAVESEDQIDKIAGAVARAGARVLRGGAFKPRTSPYSFQGLGEDGLRMLREAAGRHGLKVVSEVMEVGQIALVSEYVDILQVGARNMQNFQLLKALGRTRLPILLKRGLAATLEEWLLAAEYVMDGGNHQVILCERGIRSFDKATRNTLDLAAVPAIKDMSHLPVIVDPSHGTGLRDKVAPMAGAAIAAGADGLLIEVHDAPEAALSDGAQSLEPAAFKSLVGRLRVIAEAVGRTLA